jgi:hypothetical protein
MTNEEKLQNSFETGRVYDCPQVIEWQAQEDGSIMFRDASRGIDGIISAPEYGQKANARYVLAMYDAGSYQ